MVSFMARHPMLDERLSDCTIEMLAEYRYRVTTTAGGNRQIYTVGWCHECGESTRVWEVDETGDHQVQA